MTFLRPALHADREELARFECARPERQFEIDVEEFVRDAISWLENSGEIVGIVMHEDDDATVSSTRWRFEVTDKQKDSASSCSAPSSTISLNATQAT